MAAESTSTARKRREPWPWILAGLLASMIASSLLLLAIAIRHPDAPVGDEATSGRVRAQSFEAPSRVAERAAAQGPAR